MQATLRQLTVFELSVCRLMNQVENPAVLAVFRTVNWLGNWPIWPMLIVAIYFVDGSGSYPALRHIGLLSIVSLTLYKCLKNTLARERPCVTHAGSISQLVAPLDRYSFPSGHSLHAFAFTPVFVYYYPGLIWLLAPYSLLVCLSRVILGVHYPSDVIAGVSIGALLAALSFAVL